VQRRCIVSPVKYELVYIQKDDILHSHRRENLKSYLVGDDNLDCGLISTWEGPRSLCAPDRFYSRIACLGVKLSIHSRLLLIHIVQHTKSNTPFVHSLSRLHANIQSFLLGAYESWKCEIKGLNSVSLSAANYLIKEFWNRVTSCAFLFQQHKSIDVVSEMWHTDLTFIQGVNIFQRASSHNSITLTNIQPPPTQNYYYYLRIYCHLRN
jgi:hypothetical protein